MSFENHPTASAQFTLISPSATPFYKANFEGLDGWSGTGGTTYARLAESTRNGALGLALAATNDGTPPVYEASARRLLSGLTVGQTYLFTAWGKLNGSRLGSGLGMRIGVLGGPQAPWQTDVVEKWASFGLLFTATQTSHQLILESSTDGGNYAYWADVALSVGVDPLSVSEGDVTLDKGVAPYGQSSVTVPLMDEALLERLDPYANQRVKITAAADGHWEPRYSAWVEQRRNFATNPHPRFSTTSWTGSSGTATTPAIAAGGPPGLARSYQRTGNTIPSGARSQLTIPGLVIGETYHASVWVWIEGTPAAGSWSLRITTTSGGTTGPILVNPIPERAQWVRVSGTFVASVETMYLQLRRAGTAGTASDTETWRMTGVMVERGSELRDYFDGDVANPDILSQYIWTGASNGSPSVFQTRIQSDVLWVEDNPRTFDLVMRNRRVNHADKTVDLDLATDEAILMTYAPLADDVSAVARQNSLRSIINYVLDKASPGAALQPGTLDVPFRVLNDAENRITNPRITGLGEIGTSNLSITYDTTWPGPQNGVAHNGVHLYNPTQSDSYVSLGGDVGALRLGMQPGKTYTFSAEGSVRSVMGGTAGGRERSLVIHHRIGSNGWTVIKSPAIPNVAQTGSAPGTRVEVTFTLPPGTTEAFVRAYHGQTSGTITWGKFRFSETVLPDGPHNTEYFWGSKPAGTEYAYQWSGTADASTSRRIALIDRAPELLMWNAGDDAWSFLEPLMTSSKLKLWADEQRRWWLTDPAEYSVPGRVIATVSNTVEGTDTIDADDGPQLDGAIARFNWIDYNGDRQQRDDFAGSPGRVRVFEFDRPYPGPGTAAAIMRRYTGQKRTQEVTVPSNYQVTPGQEISISLPGTADQLGRLQSVHWQLAEGVMDLGASGITEVTPGSWLARDPEQDWDEVTDTETWGSLT